MLSLKKSIKAVLLDFVLRIIKHIIKLPFPILSLIEPDYHEFCRNIRKKDTETDYSFQPFSVPSAKKGDIGFC